MSSNENSSEPSEVETRPAAQDPRQTERWLGSICAEQMHDAAPGDHQPEEDVEAAEADENSPITLSDMTEHRLKERLEGALHRGHNNATEQELVAVTAIVLAIIEEFTAELVVVIADLTDRVAELEAAHSPTSPHPATASDHADPATAAPASGTPPDSPAP